MDDTRCVDVVEMFACLTKRHGTSGFVLEVCLRFYLLFCCGQIGIVLWAESITESCAWQQFILGIGKIKQIY